MKEVLLFNPLIDTNALDFSDNIPANLLCLGSFLEERGYSVALIDACSQKDYKDQIKKKARNVDYMGTGFMTMQIPNALETCKLVKDLNPDIKIIAGGVHPTLFPEQTSRNKLIDVVVKGEGEETFIELINAFEKKLDIKKIRGISFHNNNHFFDNADRPLIDVDKLPNIHWNLIDKEVISLYKTKKTKSALLLHSSRGCPHRCTFCINVCTNNRSWRGRKAAKVIDEIESMVNDLGVSKIKFRDECFFVDKKRVKEILKGTIERKIDFSWEANSRVNYFCNGVIDDEVIELMKKTNCYENTFGVESGSQRMIDEMKKDIKLQHVITTVKKLKAAGINGLYSFMIGLPGETKDDMKKTIQFMNYLKKLDPKMSKVLGPQPYRPYPGGEMYEEALRLGWKEPANIEDWRCLLDENKISISAKYFPWVDDANFLDSIWLFNGFALSTWENTWKMSDVKTPKIFLLLFALDAKIRWKLGLHDYFYEMKIVNRFNKWINR